MALRPPKHMGQRLMCRLIRALAISCLAQPVESPIAQRRAAVAVTTGQRMPDDRQVTRRSAQHHHISMKKDRSARGSPDLRVAGPQASERCSSLYRLIRSPR